MGKGKKGRAKRREYWRYQGLTELDGHIYYTWKRGRERYYWLRTDYLRLTKGKPWNATG